LTYIWVHYISFMYIRKVKKRNRGSDKNYEYLHLVESVRTEKGPRQRLVLNLRALDIPPDRYKELANCIEGMLLGQFDLFSSDPVIEKHAGNAVRDILEKRSCEQKHSQAEKSWTKDPAADYREVDVASMEASELRSLGPEYVCHSIWKQLRFDEIFRNCCK